MLLFFSSSFSSSFLYYDNKITFFFFFPSRYISSNDNDSSKSPNIVFNIAFRICRGKFCQSVQKARSIMAMKKDGIKPASLSQGVQDMLLASLTSP